MKLTEKDKEFGKELRELRIKHSITLRRMTNLLCLNPSRLSLLESYDAIKDVCGDSFEEHYPAEAVNTLKE